MNWACSPITPRIVRCSSSMTWSMSALPMARTGRPRIFHGQWSSPSTGKVNGRQLIFFGGGDGWCYAFDAKPVKEGDGNFLKTVRKFDCNPPEHKADKSGKPYK